MKNNDTYFELRATLRTIMTRDRQYPLAAAVMQLLNDGHILVVDRDADPPTYMLDECLDEVNHLTPNLQNRVHRALLELCALQQLYFQPQWMDLCFSAVRSASEYN
jgi:hypothetical protein